MAITPAQQNFPVYRGSTFDMTLTLVSGNSNVPINLTGFNSNIIIGPYFNLSSSLSTVSGSVNVIPQAGQIHITIASASSYIYSPQPYYVSLTTPSGANYYILNGIINFISPFGHVIIAPLKPLVVGSLDFTIDVTNFDDLTPVPQPPGGPPNVMGAVWGNVFNS